MPFRTGFRRHGAADTTKPWAEKLEAMYVADHPRYPSQYNAYLHYIAFLTAGTIEHHWAEGDGPDHHPQFVPLGRTEDFLPDLHKKMRTFREHRYINGFSSPELVRDSYELLGLLGERVPSDNLERFLAIARTYITQHEDECLTA
jgi:hypothetical protein